MREEAPESYRAALLQVFAEELERLHASAGRPEPEELDALGGSGGGVSLSPATVTALMAGRVAPTWEFVATFVSACREYAVAAGREVAEGDFSLDGWRRRYERLLEALAEDPPPAAPTPGGPDGRAVPSTLPPGPEYFIGREAELDRLQSFATLEPRSMWLIVLEGEAGIGKTATATVLAHHVAHLYPDGQLFVSLDAGGGGPDVVGDRLGGLLRTLGVAEADLPESRTGLLGLLRARMEERRLLIVLDDVPDPEMIEALDPRGAEPSSLLIVTSRDGLADLSTLNGVAYLRLERLPDTGVRELLRERLGWERLRGDPAAVARLLPIVAGLPLVMVLLVGLLGRSGGPSVTEVVDSLQGGEESESVRGVVERSYAALGPPAAATLRRLSLVDDHEEIPPQLVGFLAGDLDLDAVPAVIEELSAAGLVSTAGDGGILLLHDLIREYGRERAAAEDSPEEIAAVRDRARRFFLLARGHRPRPEPSITRDFWTLHDRLSYTHYAAAIAEFVRHRQTLPPLTIGLKAPWGAGKTSLMRMIQNILDPREGDEPCRIRLEGASSSGRVTNREVLRAAGEGPEDAPGRLRAHRTEDVRQPAGEWRPTVWFNPWMYQSGEQIWAGLAHEIITQVTDRLPVADRERFWLRLNLARVDRSVIRRRWYRLVAERLVPLLAVWLVAVVVSVVGLALAELLGAVRDIIRSLAATVLGAGTLVLLFGGAARAFSFLGGTAAGPLSALVRGADPLAGGQRMLADQVRTGFDELVPDPGYAGRLGFLHLVQTDMKRVLDLIATPERPLVVFVDDLDRCSPGAVTQVIEAINLFLAGEFPHCVFVIGMEPGTVAAHVEVAYQDLVRAQRDGRLAGDWSTLGWRFLEKIVQLPLSIPPPRGGDDIAGYLRSLTGTGTAPAAGAAPDRRRAASAAGGAGGPAPTRPVPTRRRGAADPSDSGISPAAADRDLARPYPEDVDAIERNLRARRPTPDTLREMALAAQFEVLGLPDPLRPASLAAADRLISDLYSDVDAHAALEELLPVLASRNPREIKRFVNLFRFFSFIAERQRLLGAPMPEQRQIAKLAAFAIRWPHVISMLGTAETDSVLGDLERVAREHGAERWEEELRRRFPVFTPVPAPDPTLPDAPPPGWGDDLRAFLCEGVEIAGVASRFV